MDQTLRVTVDEVTFTLDAGAARALLMGAQVGLDGWEGDGPGFTEQDVEEAWIQSERILSHFTSRED